MGDVIDFPGRGEAAIQKAFGYFRNIYVKAGLSDDQTAIAMAELEPIVRSFLVKKEFELNLSGNFSDEQISLIKEAHNLTMQSMIDYFSNNLWLALCHIAGLIGRGAQEA